MQVIFKPRDPLAVDLRELAEHRVRFALRRLRWAVPRAEVQLSDVNGPRGGADKHCQLALRTDGSGPVVVSAVGSNWREALDEALARAVRMLVRLWHRNKAHRRQRVRGPLPGGSNPGQPLGGEPV